MGSLETEVLGSVAVQSEGGLSSHQKQGNGEEAVASSW